jgi:predicted SprT family Zn-dependent metalloprotease
MNPTQQQFEAYQKIFDYMNQKLFGGSLPGCLLNFSRKAKTYGFFAGDQWQSGEEKTHEISLNPAHLARRPTVETVSTLVHEMGHLWQHVYGQPGRGGYHNKQWAEKMESIGLIPSDTEAPGGKKTGDKVSHYVLKGGPSEKAFGEMPKEYLLPWVSVEVEKESKIIKKNKLKYQCPGCGMKVWGKPGLKIICGECVKQLEGVF